MRTRGGEEARRRRGGEEERRRGGGEGEERRRGGEVSPSDAGSRNPSHWSVFQLVLLKVQQCNRIMERSKDQSLNLGGGWTKEV